MATPPLNIAARVPVTEAEGPGRRFALWVQGCPMRCPGCCNPQYLPFESARAERVRAEDLADEILRFRDEIEGVTLIGGEPFAQASGLAEVAGEVRRHGLSVMVFSGFTLEELRDPSHPDQAERSALLSETDLLVDGRYRRDQLVDDRRWIGSANQRIHFLTGRYRHLDETRDGWDPGRNTLEIRMRDGEMSINGFPHPDISKLSGKLSKR